VNLLSGRFRQGQACLRSPIMTRRHRPLREVGSDSSRSRGFERHLERSIYDYLSSPALATLSDRLMVHACVIGSIVRRGRLFQVIFCDRLLAKLVSRRVVANSCSAPKWIGRRAVLHVFTGGKLGRRRSKRSRQAAHAQTTSPTRPRARRDSAP
jgi:hypothetical protein